MSLIATMLDKIERALSAACEARRNHRSCAGHAGTIGWFAVAACHFPAAALDARH
jgi:hypothetical protein